MHISPEVSAVILQRSGQTGTSYTKFNQQICRSELSTSLQLETADGSDKLPAALRWLKEIQQSKRKVVSTWCKLVRISHQCLFSLACINAITRNKSVNMSKTKKWFVWISERFIWACLHQINITECKCTEQVGGAGKCELLSWHENRAPGVVTKFQPERLYTSEHLSNCMHIFDFCLCCSL